MIRAQRPDLKIDVAMAGCRGDVCEVAGPAEAKIVLIVGSTR